VRVFLSGPIDGLAIAEAAGWRRHAAHRFAGASVAVYDPTEVITATPGYLPVPNEVVTNDRYNLRRSDVVLVNLELPATIATNDAPFFTIGEMFLAHDLHVPIITVGKAFRGRPGYEAIVTRSFDDLDDAISHIIATYAGNTP
jgi:hypothetical protein